DETQRPDGSDTFVIQYKHNLTQKSIGSTLRLLAALRAHEAQTLAQVDPSDPKVAASIQVFNSLYQVATQFAAQASSHMRHPTQGAAVQRSRLPFSSGNPAGRLGLPPLSLTVMATERWLPIPLDPYRDHYDLSDRGRVRRTAPGAFTRPGKIIS